MRGNRIFDPENVVFRNLARLTDIIGLSLVWLIFSLPVVTVGPASAALYHAVRRCVVEREYGTYTIFWRSFRQNLKTGLAATVLVLIAAGILGIGRQVMLTAASQLGGYAVVLYYAYLVLLTVPGGILCWMFPLLSRFTFRPGGLMATGLRITMGYLPYTLVIVLIGLAAALAAWALVVLALVLPCVTALAWSLVMERVFRKYMPAEPDTPETPEDPELPEE